MRAMMPLLAALAVAGCQDWRSGQFGAPSPTMPTDQASNPQPGAATDTAPPANDNRGISPGEPADPNAGQDVMAQVNGSPVYMASLYDLLVRADGLRMARHVISSQLVNAAAAEGGLTASDQEIQAEHDQTLQRMFPNVPEAVQRQRLLEELMLRENTPTKAWRMSMRRNVLLGKLLAEETDVSQEELRQAYADRYGRKVVVRHIQSANLADAQDAMEKLRAGADFAQLAAKVSKNASAARGGLLPAVGAKTNLLPKALHKVAWAMKTPGELSQPIKVGTTYHILCLQRVIEPQDVSFQDAAGQLEPHVRARNTRNAKTRLLEQMISQADIKWVDPILANSADGSGPDDQEDLP